MLSYLFYVFVIVGSCFRICDILPLGRYILFFPIALLLIESIVAPYIRNPVGALLLAM
ncbi:hypothetical protein SAMN02745219_03115 [Desulfofundulus thermosubterraneus DSM 16057]|uniref:Uncharacterized protein n=1 Tax=Desulfofundulus thermosubterraneus DSM 16057 TaxID=1121432 RepID=A0A1M6LCW9_9FIRM|nr:hypothetical protein SAMN02745219_03115 [Desulfofundulus thermosubterraneus DSM 16057]